jgi:3-methylfumaryl-CoA hydratase
MNESALLAYLGQPPGSDLLQPQPLHALGALLDHAPRAWHDGDPIPPGWQWLYFLPRTPQSELDADGHPRRPPSLPPIETHRRLFGGGRMQYRRPLRVGEIIRRESSAGEIVRKQGRRGELTLFTIRHVYRDAHGIVLEEEQDIVYTGAPIEPTGPPAPEPPPAAWNRTVIPDAMMLFRFSALTFNAHRIHYDRDYVRGQGYPDLVVHGPLLAILLLDLAERNGVTIETGTIAYRALAPVFVETPIPLRGEAADGSRVSLGAWRSDGVQSMAISL